MPIADPPRFVALNGWQGSCKRNLQSFARALGWTRRARRAGRCYPRLPVPGNPGTYMKRLMRKSIRSLVATKLLLLSTHAVAHPSGNTHAQAKSRNDPSSAPDAEPLLEPNIAPKTLFAVADSDRDGSVSFGELVAVVNGSIARRLERRFRQLDLNHDGRCTLAEVNKMSAARFARFDLDGNGSFTLSELTVTIKRVVSARLNQL